jgi:hypothetical protein
MPPWLTNAGLQISAGLFDEMKKFQLRHSGISSEITALLFAAWAQYYATDSLNFQQHGSGSTAEGTTTYSFGDPTKDNFVLEVTPAGDWSVRSSSGISDKDVEAIITSALEKVSSGDLGGDVVYQTTLQAKPFSMSPVAMSNFARLLGDQRWIAGARRLGDRVLLDFVPAQPEDPSVPQLFAPQTDVSVTVFVPGPIASDLTQKIAAGIVEVVSAVCALAMGRVVEGPMALFPAPPEHAATAREGRHDPTILGLARDSVSLDVFNEFGQLGGADGVMRVRGALLSYHAALQQASPDVALMLLVTSLEALIVPRAEWRKDKATKRFIEAIDELCPEVVDTLVNHANVEQAFAYKRRGGAKARRRQLLDQIYALRSNPTHSGIGLAGAGMFTMVMDSNTMRVALLSDLARGALLRFLQAPRSSLIGHPMFQQGPSAQ